MNILLSHGSPDEAHRHAVAALAGMVGKALGSDVRPAFLGDVLPAGARVVPLFLTRGKHLQQDVPAMLGQAGGMQLAGPADHPADMARMALELAQGVRHKQRAVMFALYRLLGAETLMAEVYGQSKAFPLPAVAGLYGQSDVAAVLSLWKQEAVGEVLIQPLLLFPGHSLEALRRKAAESGLEVSLGPALSEHQGFAGWLAERFRRST